MWAQRGEWGQNGVFHRNSSPLTKWGPQTQLVLNPTTPLSPLAPTLAPPQDPKDQWSRGRCSNSVEVCDFGHA